MDIVQRDYKNKFQELVLTYLNFFLKYLVETRVYNITESIVNDSY